VGYFYPKNLNIPIVTEIYQDLKCVNGLDAEKEILYILSRDNGHGLLYDDIEESSEGPLFED
jgi:hypothetical protein